MYDLEHARRKNPQAFDKHFNIDFLKMSNEECVTLGLVWNSFVYRPLEVLLARTWYIILHIQFLILT